MGDGSGSGSWGDSSNCFAVEQLHWQRGPTCTVTQAVAQLQLWPSFLLGCGQAVDNFAVGLGFASSGRPITVQHNAFIAFVNACGTLLTMALGEAVLAWLPGDGDSGTPDPAHTPPAARFHA